MSDKVENKLEELLLQYTYFYGMRRSNGDKKKCYAFLSEKYGEAGYPVTFGKLSVGVTKIGYCVAGDLDTARRVLIAPVDTQSKTFLPGYRFYPFQEKDSSLWGGLAALVNFLLGLLIALAGYGIAWHFSQFRWVGCLCALALIVAYLLALKGIFNFSASAPLALMHFLAVNGERKKKMAFVFLDRSADSYLGLRLFLIRHKEQLRNVSQILFLSNLAHSEKLLLASDDLSPELKKLAENCGAEAVKLEGETIPRCFNASEKLAFLTAADQDAKGKYYVKDIRCKRDKTMNVKRLKQIAEGILSS